MQTCESCGYVEEENLRQRLFEAGMYSESLRNSKKPSGAGAQ